MIVAVCLEWGSGNTVRKSSSARGQTPSISAVDRWRAGQKECLGEHVQERPVLQRFLRDGRRRLGERVRPFRAIVRRARFVGPRRLRRRRRGRLRTEDRRRRAGPCGSSSSMMRLDAIAVHFSSQPFGALGLLVVRLELIRNEVSSSKGQLTETSACVRFRANEGT